MEKRPAVSAERLTTSSPKREFWIESASDTWGEDVPFDSFTATPDQQLVINDQKVAKKRAKSSEFFDFELCLKLIMGKGIGVGSYLARYVSRHDFSVWE